MPSSESKQEREDWKAEPLLPSYTKDSQDATAVKPPAKSCCGFVGRRKRVVKLGCLFTFAAVLLTTTFGCDSWSSVPSQWKDATCEEHAQWQPSEVVEYNRRWSSNTNLTVPLSKDGLLIFVKGGVSGSVDFVEDDSLVDEAYVDLHAEYDSRTFGKTKFCTLKNAHNGAGGIGIFGPKHPGKGKETAARITVYMPKYEAPVMEKMFVIVPKMEVNFLADSKIKSKVLVVKSRKAPLHAANLECETCKFKVSHGPISGNFTVRNKLFLKTKSGKIDANITMISNATGVSPGPLVDIRTTSGSINADFTLVAVDPETEEEVPYGGAYQISTRSFRAPARLEVVDAPVDSTLSLQSKNVMGPLEVHLHPTFQGKFSSKAFIGDTPLGIRGYTKDPSGDDRKRNLVWDAWSIPPGIRHIMSGEVWWGDRPEPPRSLIFSFVGLRSIIGQPLVFLHISNSNALNSTFAN